jgi:hypothetical protein
VTDFLRANLRHRKIFSGLLFRVSLDLFCAFQAAFGLNNRRSGNLAFVGRTSCQQEKKRRKSEA